MTKAEVKNVNDFNRNFTTNFGAMDVNDFGISIAVIQRNHFKNMRKRRLHSINLFANTNLKSSLIGAEPVRAS